MLLDDYLGNGFTASDIFESDMEDEVEIPQTGNSAVPQHKARCFIAVDLPIPPGPVNVKSQIPFIQIPQKIIK